MLRQRAPVLLVVALILAGSAFTAILASRAPARAADEEEGSYEFILVETTRNHRGVREPRASLSLYRFGDFDYREPYFDRLEEFFQGYKEAIGIHHLMMVGFHVIEMVPSRDGSATFVIRVGHDDFARLISRK